MTRSEFKNLSIGDVVVTLLGQSTVKNIYSTPSFDASGNRIKDAFTAHIVVDGIGDIIEDAHEIIGLDPSI